MWNGKRWDSLPPDKKLILPVTIQMSANVLAP
jgi:hypothetical protein